MKPSGFGIIELFRNNHTSGVVLCQEKVQIKHELFTLIFYFVSMLLQFLNVLISASTSFHIHLAKCIRSDYVFLLYYKMPLCIQI